MPVSTRFVLPRLLTAIFLLGLLTASAAFAQEPPPAPPGETVDLFGLKVTQNERFKFGGEFVAGWSHDGAQAALGFEKQGRVGMAILSVGGKVSDRVRYYVSVNPVSETNSKPACGEKDFFFPNDPRLYAGAGPIVPCDPEDGLKRVDTYNTFGLDYITQQGILREGYIDWGISDAVSLRGGRFILPIGFAPRDVGAATAKDMTRIMRLNAEANYGAMLAYSARRGDRPVFDLGVMAVLGDGNREKDYDWFYFVNTSLDTNSAVTVVASARVAPIKAARPARRLQEGLHRLEGRAPAELLGVQAQRRCAGGELQAVAVVVGFAVWRIREVQVGPDADLRRAGRDSRPRRPSTRPATTWACSSRRRRSRRCASASAARVKSCRATTA